MTANAGLVRALAVTRVRPCRLTEWPCSVSQMSWFAISITYIQFCRGMDAQGFPRETLPYRNRLSKVGVRVAPCNFSAGQTADGTSVRLFYKAYYACVRRPLGTAFSLRLSKVLTFFHRP